jgi:hypothetical protein
MLLIAFTYGILKFRRSSIRFYRPLSEAAFCNCRRTECQRPHGCRRPPGLNAAAPVRRARIACRHEHVFKIAVFSLSLVCIGLTFLNVKTYQLPVVKPIVIRINELGRAEAVSYGTPDTIRKKSNPLFPGPVRAICMRATVKENYTRSLYSTAGWRTSHEANKKGKVIEAFPVPPKGRHH